MQYKYHTSDYTIIVHGLTVFITDGMNVAGRILLERHLNRLYVEEVIFWACKGKGLYRKSLWFTAFVFNTSITSYNRNEVSNAIWSKWAGRCLVHTEEISITKTNTIF